MERCPWVQNLQPQLIASSIYIYTHIEFGVLNHWLFSPLLGGDDIFDSSFADVLKPNNLLL